MYVSIYVSMYVAQWQCMIIGRHKNCCLVIGYNFSNVSEMINEWGAYAGVLPQTADPQKREVSVHKESLQIDCRIQV